MTITEKKPLLIQIPGERNPNELPMTASAVGYDFVQGNYITYATGSDSWETAPEMKPIYWQSDSSGHIYTTGSIFVYETITGSNLVLDDPASRILAPNGALVISSSAGTFITGSLIVSGARSDLGTENTSVLFNGDIFVSGGIGLNDYLQLKPVNLLRIPTNTTASYIYTSGSTNDMYFTQYQPGTGYTNTTRLRWLEATLNTGLLHGGVLSTTNGSTTFNITSGSGIVLNFNASTTTDPYPTIKTVDWLASTNVPLTYVTSSQITYIGINDSGGIIQRTTPFDPIDYETNIPIGRVLHQTGSVTNGTITSPHVSYAKVSSHDTFVRAFGPLKLSGHVLAASGSTLGLTKTGGDSYVVGRNYTSNPSSPDLVLSTTDFALTASKIYKEYVSGSTPVIDTGIGTAGYTVIDPTKYVDANGTLQTVASGQYSIQRVYWFPNSVNRALFVYYGTTTYNSIDVAQASIADEGFTEGANTAEAAIFVAYIIVKGNASNLSDDAQAKIIQAPLFRAAGVGGGAAGGGTTTPGGLDTYVQFNDGGSTFGGVAGLTFNKTTNTLSTTNLAVSNIATVSGSVILGDAASDVVYISGSVTASNGLTVTGSIYTQMIKVNGSITDPAQITVPGYGIGPLVGSAFFDDTVTNGGTYGTVIRSQAGDYAYATLTFVQDNTYVGALAGLINTPSIPLGYRGGLNISAPQGKVINFRFNSNPTLSVGNFNANGLEVTGSLNVSNGGFINAGGLRVAGNLSDGGFNGPVIIDDTVTNGSSYGVVIRNQSADPFAAANLTLVQNSTYIGAVSGLNNTPSGITYGILGGVNISALKEKTINFRAVDLGSPSNSYSFGKFSSTGLDVTGVVTASLGFSGSLTTLTDGSPYLIAGNNVSITTGSNGAVTVNAITSSNFFRLELLDYEALSSVTSTTLGQVIFPANEYTGSLTLRGVIYSNDATNTGSIQLYNVTSGAYVDIGGPGVKHLSVTGTIPTIIQSVNLISASGFSSSSQAIYELVASSSNALNTSFFGSFEIRPQGTFQLNGGSGGSPGGSSGQIQYNDGGSFGGVTNLTWDGATLNATGSFLGNLNGTASYATVAASLTTSVFNVALNGSAPGVSTNIGGIYIPASTTVTTKSLAYIGGSTVSEVAVLKLVPINSVTVSASWVVTGTLTSVSLSSPVTLGPGWYDLTLETGTVSQTAFGRGLYLTSGDI